MVAATAAPRGAAMLTCRRALRGAEATTSAGAGGALLQRRVRSTQRVPARHAPSALLKVREDLRAAGAITWSQVRRAARDTASAAAFRSRHASCALGQRVGAHLSAVFAPTCADADGGDAARGAARPAGGPCAH